MKLLNRFFLVPVIFFLTLCACQITSPSSGSMSPASSDSRSPSPIEPTPAAAASFDPDEASLIDQLSREGSKMLPKADEKAKKEWLEIAKVLGKAQIIYWEATNTPEYVNRINEIFVNTYDPVPQEALENILSELSTVRWLSEHEIYKYNGAGKNIKISHLDIRDTRASVTLGNYFYNSHELVKLDGKWRITGLSTWVGTKERTNLAKLTNQYLDCIRQGNRSKALAYWESNSDFDVKNRAIVEKLLEKKDKISLEIGEIEFWGTSDPHRVPTNSFTNEAKVKILIKENGKTEKFKLFLSREGREDWIIRGWSDDPKDLWHL